MRTPPPSPIWSIGALYVTWTYVVPSVALWTPMTYGRGALVRTGVGATVAVGVGTGAVVGAVCGVGAAVAATRTATETGAVAAGVAGAALAVDGMVAGLGATVGAAMLDEAVAAALPGTAVTD